ncbi:MAG: Bax inhibitor-1/YccA family protein [Alphaproteobacteria bacterium]|nr:Bax inhibitor-1/YccA family protein [Alphaproteobacteria bacterium]
MSINTKRVTRNHLARSAGTPPPGPAKIKDFRGRAQEGNATNGLGLYLKRVFALMFGAVALTAIASWLTIYMGGITLFVNQGGFSALYYIILFGGLGLSIWAQVRAFSMSPATGGLMLAIYSILMGFAITPLVWGALMVNPASILQAFVISAVMFGCMALFGYKTARDLSFLGIFLFMGMIGLILVGLVSMIWPLGGTFATIVSAIGVLVFALFTAYDMQFQKRAYASVSDERQKNQLAVLGALHLYISFIAMFQYVLSLLNRR